MPVTRRKRATSPEQPENTNTAAQTPEQAAGSPAEASATELSTTEKAASTEKSSLVDSVAENPPTEQPEATAALQTTGAESASVAAQETSPVAPDMPAQPGNETRAISHLEMNEPAEADSLAAHRHEAAPAHHRAEAPVSHPRRSVAARAASENGPYQPLLPAGSSNGERPDRQEYPSSPIEGGRRTARGELFRRPPQQPAQPYLPALSQPSQPSQPSQLQAPTHEISLPLGNLLHLAYNPGYTGSEEARSVLLHQLEDESKAGGRARCWNCGSLAIVYDRWNTRSKTFGEIGIAYCEICGVWSVM